MYEWLSQALYQIGQRNESIQIACAYCWQFAEREPTFLLDAKSRDQLNQFKDQGLDEDWGWRFFPCWLLLHEPGLSGHISRIDKDEADAFSLLQQMLPPKQLDNGQMLDLRARLKAAHNGVFDRYLSLFSQG